MSSERINSNPSPHLPPGQATQGTVMPKVKHCQVTGCTQDLHQLGRKYYLKKKICDKHMKADVVLRQGCGQQLFRFCQQCGKLQPLHCFDGHKRSCRLSLTKRRNQASKATDDTNSDQPVTPDAHSDHQQQGSSSPVIGPCLLYDASSHQCPEGDTGAEQQQQQWQWQQHLEDWRMDSAAGATAQQQVYTDLAPYGDMAEPDADATNAGTADHNQRQCQHMPQDAAPAVAGQCIVTNHAPELPDLSSLSGLLGPQPDLSGPPSGPQPGLSGLSGYLQGQAGMSGLSGLSPQPAVDACTAHQPVVQNNNMRAVNNMADPGGWGPQHMQQQQGRQQQHAAGSSDQRTMSDEEVENIMMRELMVALSEEEQHLQQLTTCGSITAAVAAVPTLDMSQQLLSWQQQQQQLEAGLCHQQQQPAAGHMEDAAGYAAGATTGFNSMSHYNTAAAATPQFQMTASTLQQQQQSLAFQQQQQQLMLPMLTSFPSDCSDSSYSNSADLSGNYAGLPVPHRTAAATPTPAAAAAAAAGPAPVNAHNDGPNGNHPTRHALVATLQSLTEQFGTLARALQQLQQSVTGFQ